MAGTFAPRVPKLARSNTGKLTPYFVPACAFRHMGSSTIVFPSNTGDRVQNVAAVLRFDDSRWLVCGRLVQGGAFAALYSPLDWELKFLQTPATRAFVSGSSSVERSLSLIVGSDGTALRTEGELTTVSIVPGAPDLSASALDVLDREWVASLGTLWTRDPRLAEAWRPAWSDRSWDAPFVSMIADSGRLMAMTANAAIVEGRLGASR